MLVLMRKTYQKILIGDDVVITVIEVRGNAVRLGIDAPKGIAVDREEVRESKNQSGDNGG